MTLLGPEQIATAASALLRRELRLVRQLSGGQHAETVLVTDGQQELVVRVFPEGDGAPRREQEILSRLGSIADIAPRLVAVDERMIVTSALAGSTPSPQASLLALARELARALARIHRLDGTGLPVAPTAWPGDEPGGSEIVRRARTEWQDLDVSERVLTHGDFWSGNAVWEGEVLRGVVDWSGARHGPRGVDLAWFRQDLVLLGSTDAAEHFLREYERHAALRVADMHAWDVQAAARADAAVETWAPNYHGIGRHDLTPRVLRTRLDDWIASL